MRILLIAHNIIRGDGQGRINLEIASHALTSGHFVTLLADSVAPELPRLGATWVKVRPWLQKPNILKVYEFARQANHFVRTERQNFDVVVGNGYVLSEPHHINMCQFVHGAWGRSSVHVGRLRSGPYGWYQRQYTIQNTRTEALAFSRARIVVAPSNKIVNDLTSVGVTREKIRVIYNGVDPNEFRTGRTDRSSFGLWADCPLAIFAGDIRTPRKNLDTVLKALARVPTLRLAVVGELRGSPFPALARQLGVADRVAFLGYRRDVHAVMRACDFFVFPSRYEAGALVLLEAMSSGLPVISATSAGGAELVSRSAGFVLEDSEDVGGLAAAMRTLAEDPTLRSCQAAEARAVAERHSWVLMAAKYLELFEECAGETARRESQLRCAGEPAPVR